MKVALALVFGLWFSAFAMAEEARVSVRAALAEVPAEMTIPADPMALAKVQGVDFVVLPAVTTALGGPAKFKLTRDFGGAGDGPAPEVGVKLTVIPKLEGGKIYFVADFDITEFTGFANGADGKKTPMFDVRQTLGMKGDTAYGKAAVMTALQRKERQTVEEEGKPTRLEVTVKKILVILTFEKAE